MSRVKSQRTQIQVQDSADIGKNFAMIDGNEATAWVAYRTSEVIAIYPITPSSAMGELSDQWSAQGVRNIWGTVPRVVELQSEAGAAGAVHGSLQAGSLTTTFTASQGLLLMIPNMYKIAGELTSVVFHIAARSIATQSLSIFGDHSDVMAARSTGWALLFSNSVQEAMDFALIAQAATLEGRVPFLHVFDGFRTSHEVQKVERLAEDDVRAMIDDHIVRAHRARALSPDRPFVRGTTQNPDTFFQAREAVNPYYLSLPAIVQEAMDRLASRSGRHYRLFDYVGAPDAERVIVMMGSGCGTAEETVRYLSDRGEKVGLVKVRLFRPFSVARFVRALPESVTSIAVLDRTKEPGAVGEPLYQDVVTALNEGVSGGATRMARMPRVTGGRYGLSSKEFTPAMVAGVFEEIGRPQPKNHFTVGIVDDVTHTSIDRVEGFELEPDDVTRAIFWGLGSDGTVGANKNTIKIIGESTTNYAQGYFVYDSRKSGARTISHLRFGPRPINSAYLIQKADFVAVHQYGFVTQYDVLREARAGATFLLNSPYARDEVWGKLPRAMQEEIIEKKLQFYAIDAYKVAREKKLGGRINTIMQTAFFALSGVLPREEAIDKIKDAIRKSYGRRGDVIVEMNNSAVDAAVRCLHRIDVPEEATAAAEERLSVPNEAPAFVRDVTAKMMSGDGDRLPVSALPADGTFPSGTARWEKRNIAQIVPIWESDICIQCGKCVMVCPHSVIRSKIFDPADAAGAPADFKTVTARWRDFPGKNFTIQVAAEDCTGCSLCVEVCPAKDKSKVGRKAINMRPAAPVRDAARTHWDFFLSLPHVSPSDENDLRLSRVRDVQLSEPLFEFPTACAGCGETPYLRLMTQLFGDRAIVANATGCSSIYGGNLPTTPWSVNSEGRGPAWCNSLFEDNAEFGFGIRLALDKQIEYARELLDGFRAVVGDELVGAILGVGAKASDSVDISVQRAWVESLKEALRGRDDGKSLDLLGMADVLVPRSVWIVGGDGWAYDIGFGGLDHVLASGHNVNVLVLDTEVYSNTGGQASKSTPTGAIAKFAANGKERPKKDLGMLAMSYGNVYVAQVAMGANDTQTLKAFLDAESYDGPSLIIAYSHCIAHGIDMSHGMQQQKLATASGHWPLYRFDPRLRQEGGNSFQLDSKGPSIPLGEYIYSEGRYRMLVQAHPKRAAELLSLAQNVVNDRWARFEQMAKTGES